jgi:hypothetical protein
MRVMFSVDFFVSYKKLYVFCFIIIIIPLVHTTCVQALPVKAFWSYRAGLFLQRWQHVLIQAASPLWASHPFPHFHTFLPVLQPPSLLRPNFGRFVGPRDGATATYQGGSNSDIILDSAKWNSGTPDSRTSFRGVENRGRICPAPGVEPVTIRMGSGRHRFYATVVSVVVSLVGAGGHGNGNVVLVEM